ncbi:hypothetical protein [Streptosporangium sp. NPDC006930]
MEGTKKGEFDFQLSWGSRFVTPVVALGCVAGWSGKIVATSWVGIEYEDR